MKNKSILIVSYMFTPMGGGGVMRIKSLADFLRKNNWSVTVFTEKASNYGYDVYDYNNLPSPEINIITPSGEDKDRFIKKENIQKKHQPQKNFKRKIKESFFQFVRKLVLLVFPDTVIKYLIKGIIWGYKTTKEYDVVLATIRPPSNAVIAYFYCIFKRKSLVVEYRDLWYGQEFQRNTWAYKFVNKFYESQILKKAKHIVCVSPRYIDILSKRYPKLEKKMVLLTNGFTEEYFHLPVDNSLPTKERNRLSIAHFGRFYGPRKIDEVLKELGKIDDKLKLQHFGPKIENSDCNLEKFSFFSQEGYIGFKECWVKQRSNSIDALLLIEYTSDNIPGKIFEYYASGKPVVVICPKESVIREVFKNIQYFYFIDNNNINELTRIIEDLASMQTIPSREIDMNVDVFYRNNIYMKYEGLLDGEI